MSQVIQKMMNECLATLTAMDDDPNRNQDLWNHLEGRYFGFLDLLNEVSA